MNWILKFLFGKKNKNKLTPLEFIVSKRIKDDEFKKLFDGIQSHVIVKLIEEYLEL